MKQAVSCRSLWFVSGMLSLLLMVLLTTTPVRADQPRSRMILGYVERVWLSGEGVSAKARLDTGAGTSSIDARNVEIFEREGKRWVRFEFATRDPEHPRVRLERRLKRHVRIKRHADKNQRRPVVKLNICVGGRQVRSEFNLVNREKFIYPVLLGRSALKEIALVDPGAVFLGGRDCGNRKRK